MVSAVPPTHSDVELVFVPTPEGLSTIAEAVALAGFKLTQGANPMEQAD